MLHPETLMHVPASDLPAFSVLWDGRLLAAVDSAGKTLATFDPVLAHGRSMRMVGSEGLALGMSRAVRSALALARDDTLAYGWM